MTWTHGTWAAEHAVPLGIATRAAVGDLVRAGDVVASGSELGTPLRVPGASHLGVDVRDLDGVMRVPVGAEVRRGMVLARTGRRFARSVTSPVDGRIVHRTADGDLILAPAVGSWTVRSTLDGTVTRSDDAVVTVEGEAWALSGIAAYGPDAIGDLALAVDAPVDDLQPSRIDVRLRGTILVGGARVAAEAVTRAHACGVAGCVAGAAPAGGLRVVYGDDVGAEGLVVRDDRPTVLCLLAFGAAPLPLEIFRPLVQFAGSRAAIHSASARLFVFAPADPEVLSIPPALALANDHLAVGPLDGAELIGDTRFESEVTASAISTADGPVPVRNVLPFDARR